MCAVLLPVGSRLGPYEIVGKVGEGGMGEVYRARDTRLDRDVAVKVLPHSVAADPDRRARFEREAKAVAALSHSNILAIHDVGESEGIAYAVTELLDGETLRDRLKAGALPVRKAVDVAMQIARGLAAAHDRGLIHRDLKPENVFLLKDGQVKILDFGLARHASTGAGSGATETVAAITDPGTVMGTVGYMAPEQVRGRAVDARADIFSLGAVLYEMLTGKRAFQGDTSADTMTAILREDPPQLSGVRSESLPALDRIVRHCLEKNPAERFQSARDVAFALEAFSGASMSSASGPAPAIAAPRRHASYLVVAAAAVAGLAAGMLIDRTQRASPTPISFETRTWDEQWISNARFGPDGQTIVYSAMRDSTEPVLYAIRPGTMTSQPIGEVGTHLLAVSSKGELAVLAHARSIGHRLFRGTLSRMTMDGGLRPWLEDVSEADWSPDGETAAVTRSVGASMRLEYPIGHPLYEVKGGYLSDLRVSPDGTRVAFFEHQIVNDDRGWVKVVGGSGPPRTLAGEYHALEGLAWSADGRSIYFSGEGGGVETLQPIVVNVDGAPRPHQAIASASGMFVQDVARDGRVLVMADNQRGISRVLVPGETAEREFPWLDLAYHTYLTRDHKSVIFGDESQSAGTNYAVALRDLATSRVTRLGEGSAMAPSPDDKWASALIPTTEQVVLYPLGIGDPVKLPKGPIQHYRDSLEWFPDGKRVLLCGNEPDQASRCYEQDIQGGPPKPATPENVLAALVAGDGRTLVARRTDRTSEVIAIGAASGTPAKGIAAEDALVAWAPNGREIVVQDTRKLVPASVSQVDPQTGARRLLRTIAPPNRPGTTAVVVDQWIDDGRGYAYTYFVELSRLFVASGVGR